MSYLPKLDATPAPLDPSKVKAGDTVTLVGGHGTELAGPVEKVVRHTDGRPGFWVNQMTFYIGEHWTLAAHQPAPEPEPEWKPGTVWAGSPHNSCELPVWVIDVDADNPIFMDERGNSFGPGELRDLRPLVVIDPADVDVDALLDSALARLSDDPHVPTTYTVLKTVLSVLGIEVA